MAGESARQRSDARDQAGEQPAAAPWDTGARLSVVLPVSATLIRRWIEDEVQNASQASR
jgi:hypothetical protein